MTNAELIAKIKAEIERRIKRNKEEYAPDGLFEAQDNLAKLLSFLSTLEEPVSDDLEEAAGDYASDGTGFIDMTAYRAFIAGAKWDRSKIMQDAVEGDYDCQYITPAVFLDKYLDGIKDGDKVRVIVCKKED